MRNVLKTEQLLILVLVIIIYANFQFSWIFFAILFFSPDLMMLGYLINNKFGAVCYNIVHTYIFSVGLILVGLIFNNDLSLKLGFIFSAHIAFDRTLCYGLKIFKGFKSTHLGEL